MSRVLVMPVPVVEFGSLQGVLSVPLVGWNTRPTAVDPPTDSRLHPSQEKHLECRQLACPLTKRRETR